MVHNSPVAIPRRSECCPEASDLGLLSPRVDELSFLRIALSTLDEHPCSEIPVGATVESKILATRTRKLGIHDGQVGFSMSHWTRGSNFIA